MIFKAENSTFDDRISPIAWTFFFYCPCFLISGHKLFFLSCGKMKYNHFPLALGKWLYFIFPQDRKNIFWPKYSVQKKDNGSISKLEEKPNNGGRHLKFPSSFVLVWRYNETKKPVGIEWNCGRSQGYAAGWAIGGRVRRHTASDRHH